uniref:probable G-protein coupled receptor 27 isoform X1 n=1 Tax=Halichoerus grypus TaxID=9711 RepID=UPI00165927BD|nr:probable G-protein coupled receptor 27 isoform X1 [Halichoerus grypus]
MANASEPGGGGGGGEAAALGLKLATLSLLLCVSLAGNVLFALLIVRERSLHRAPYYLLLDLCLADGLRALACLPAVMLAARRAAAAAGAQPGALGCKLLAFLAALFCFHAAFLLLGVGVTRYLAIAHHRFYAERLAGWPCAAMLVCAAWALALAAAFPPVLDGGGGDDEDAPCALEQRPDGAPGALGFLLLLAVVVGATHLVYLRLLFFIHDRRKMRPARLVPAVSHDWTFHGPGATGQAAANWTAGFGRGPRAPPPGARGVQDGEEAVQDVLRRHPALPAALGALRRGQLPAGLGAARRRPPGLPDGLRVADLCPGRHQPCRVLPLQQGAEGLLQGPVPLLSEPPDHPGLPPLRPERHWLMRGSPATYAAPNLSLWLGQ